MQACPALRTNRSRFGQCGFDGECRIVSVYSRYASGASAIAVPGWPAFACWTPSIDSVRIVSIDSCSMSEFVMDHLVEPLVSFPRPTICVCPLLAGMERVAERRVGGVFQHGDGR